MKRNVTTFLGLTLLALLLGLWAAGPAQAQQQSDLDSTLAQSASKGFLITLVRPELSSTQAFYLLDSVNIDGIVSDLGVVTGFEISGGEWATSETYQVEATLQPGNRTITIFSGKYNGRWRVEGLELATAQNSGTVAVAATEAGSTSNRVQPVSGNGAGFLILQTQSGGDFYRINADGTGLQRLSSGIDPQLSPDGTQVTFTRWEPRYELFTIKVDGTGERAWTQGWRQMKSPTWTADGQAIVFSYQDGGRLDTELRRIDLSDSQGGVDIPSNARGIDVEDGILKYAIPADAFWHLKRVDLSSGEMTDLATERHSYGPTGHPIQANLVAYKGQQGIAINNIETNTDQSVTTDWRDHTPVISPDGSRVAVSYWQDGHWEVHTMNIDGSGRQRLTTTPLSVIAGQGTIERKAEQGAERWVAKQNQWWNNAAPTWSPDGSQIAFLTDRTGQWEVWIMNSDGTNQRPMFSNGVLAGLDLNYAGVDERMLSWH